MCIICTGEIYSTDLDLIRIDTWCCQTVTSKKLHEVLYQCKNLEVLKCQNCKSLTCLDLSKNKYLKEVICDNCPSLISINLEENKNLQTLYCFCCISLTSIDLYKNDKLVLFGCSGSKSLTCINLQECKNLEMLYCSFCRILTSLSIHHSEIERKSYHGTPWITQNEDFSNNLQRLIKIQKWYRRTLIIKYMKSQEFIEWIYNPSNIGGRLYKKWLLKNLK